MTFLVAEFDIEKFWSLKDESHIRSYISDTELIQNLISMVYI